MNKPRSLLDWAEFAVFCLFGILFGIGALLVIARMCYFWSLLMLTQEW